jgi:hypothetical protein
MIISKAPTLVVIALFLVLILTLISPDPEGERFGANEGGCTSTAYKMLGWAFLHMPMNYRMGICEPKAPFALDQASRSKSMG